jgi:hypothetical protein
MDELLPSAWLTGMEIRSAGCTPWPERIARGEQQLGAEQWATLWAAGRQMDGVALLAAVEYPV